MWSRQDELNFFNDAINISSIENLMMRVRGRYYAFQLKTDNSRVNVPNSRNALIGTNTAFFEQRANAHLFFIFVYLQSNTHLS